MRGSVDAEALNAVADPAERLFFRALRSDAAALRRADAEAWRSLCEVALRTFAAPLLHATLSRDGLLDLAPEEVGLRLSRVRAWNIERWAVATRQVERIADVLAAAGVRCLMLKGAHVGRLYPVSGARAMGDIDLLVPPTQVERARRALENVGYVATDPERYEREHPDSHQLPQLRIRGGLAVEVHRTLGEGAADVPWSPGVWDRARSLGAGPALCMEPLDALLYTCKHLAVHHRFETSNGFAGLADVGVLVQRYRFDPAALRERASEWSVGPAVATCLLLARDLLRADVPAELLEAVAVPGLTQAAPSAVWLLLHFSSLGITRHLQLVTRATLNPAPPYAGIRGARPVRAAWAYARAAGLPPVDDVRLEHPRLVDSRWPRAGYALLWSRLAWRHLGLVRLLSARTRLEVRARRDAHRRALDVVLGARDKG